MFVEVPRTHLSSYVRNRREEEVLRVNAEGKTNAF